MSFYQDMLRQYGNEVLYVDNQNSNGTTYLSSNRIQVLVDDRLYANEYDGTTLCNLHTEVDVLEININYSGVYNGNFT